MWVQWDNEHDEFAGMVRELPPSLAGRGSDQLALLGYRELVSRKPEDELPRFPMLYGSSVFKRLEDGRVEETWPNADFSVTAVRQELGRMVKEDAKRELSNSDWYYIRQLESDLPVPTEVAELRGRIRSHVDWVINEKIPTLSARELVDFRWYFPRTLEQTMIDGVPTVVTDTVANAGRERTTDAAPRGLWAPPTDAMHGDPTPPVPPTERVYPDLAVPPEPLVPPPPTTDGEVPSFALDVPASEVDLKELPFTHVYVDRPEGVDGRGNPFVHLDTPDTDQEQK